MNVSEGIVTATEVKEGIKRSLLWWPNIEEDNSLGIVIN